MYTEEQIKRAWEAHYEYERRAAEVAKQAGGKPWDHEKDGHRWICIASGHGVETVECTECGIVKDFEV